MNYKIETADQTIYVKIVKKKKLLIKKDKANIYKRCFRCQSYGHFIKDCSIPVHILRSHDREGHLSEIDENPGTSSLWEKNYKIKPEDAYSNYNKINEIESRQRKYGNRQWPPIKYEGTYKRIKEIRNKTSGFSNTELGYKFKSDGKMAASNGKNMIKLESTITKVIHNEGVHKTFNQMDMDEEEDILKDDKENC
ncbi:unnamed protein product [Gordionus sp. m RMFG-2023]